MKTFILTVMASAFSLTCLRGQNVAINNDGSSPNPRALLDIKSTSKGVMLPRMSSNQRKLIAIQPGDAGLMVFDTDKQSLYIFNGSAWMPVSFNPENEVFPVNFSPAGIVADAVFGHDVAISGDYAIAGAPGVPTGGLVNQGAVYIYRHEENGWEQQAQLIAPDGAANDNFGQSVAIDGDYAVVGAPGATIGGRVSQGAVYVFTRSGTQWNFQVKLVAADGLAGDKFSEVAIDGNHIVVGAYDDAGTYNLQGAAYVFTRNGNVWTQTMKLIANDPFVLDRFGASVDIHNNFIVVGAPSKSGSGSSIGSLYVFFSANGMTWNFFQKIVDAFPETDDRLGTSVAIYNDRIVAGMPGRKQQQLLNVGQVIIYKLNSNSFTVQQTIIPDDGQSADYFGTSVDMNEHEILIGAATDPNNFINAGNVYVYNNRNNPVLYKFQQKISDVSSETAGRFGTACAIDKSSLRYIIGAKGKNLNTGGIALGILN